MLSSRVRLFATLLAIGVTLAPSLGAAQDDARRKRGNDACTPDASRLCKKFFGQGDMVILQCFKERQEHLSAPCRKFLIEVGALN
ncbi:MAG TPA: hypothetical protein VK438_07195 [Xanthobacteraceae bacterium]|nr:hypothetical protein [Xanthobacteraceae bacterium]